MLLRQELRPGPQWVSSQRSPNLLSGLGGHFLAERKRGIREWRGKNERDATEGEKKRLPKMMD